MSLGNVDLPLRQTLVAAARKLDALGLNRGSTGNLSVRTSDSAPAGPARAITFWVTPTGMPADELEAGDLVCMAARTTKDTEQGTEQGGAQAQEQAPGQGQGQASDDAQVLAGDWAPSTEWPFHLAIYRGRPDLHAVVHLHSPQATALACLRRGLPAFHYMVAVAGGDSVPCTPYHLFGTQALSAAVGAAFADRNACLMANHGLVAGGKSLAHAVKVALEIEALCGIYLQALAVGDPVLLSKAQMADVVERFRHYGAARRAGG